MANPAPDDDRDAVLREEIRTVAARARKQRRASLGIGAAAFGLAFLPVFRSAHAAIPLILLILAPVGLAWAGFAEWRVKEKVRDLRPKRRTAVLAPLWRGPEGVTRRIAGQLLRELGLPKDAFVDPQPRDPRVIDLQSDIRETGSRLGRLAGRIGLVLYLSFTALMLCRASYEMAGRTLPHGLLIAQVAALAAGTLALAAPAISRWRACKRLSQRVASLPAPERAQALLPLRNTLTEETRHLVDPLIREFHLGTEVAPAVHSTERGSEVSAEEATCVSDH